MNSSAGDEAGSREASARNSDIFLSEGKRERRKSKCQSLMHTISPARSFDNHEDDAALSEGYGPPVLSAVRIKNIFFGSPDSNTGRRREGGNVSDQTTASNESEGMMSTTDILELIKRCRRFKGQPSGTKIQVFELKKIFEGQQAALTRLLKYTELLLAAIEVEEKLVARLEERLEWGPIVESYEIRLDIMKITYEIIGTIARSHSPIISQHFTASGLHKLLLTILPKMRLPEIQMLEPNLSGLFLTHEELQLDLMHWIKHELIGKEMKSLESDKDWAVFILGKLIMAIRHPKRYEFKSQTIARILSTEAIHNFDLIKRWNTLFFDSILPLYRNLKGEKILYAFRLAFAALCQYSPIQSTYELALYNIMAMSEMLATSNAGGNQLVNQIDFLIGTFNYGGLEKKMWPRLFQTVFALLPGQSGADPFLVEVLDEPGFIRRFSEKASLDTIEIQTLYMILKGLADWAKARLAETAKNQTPELMTSLQSTNEDFINEHLIVKVLSKWEPCLEILRLHVGENHHKNRITKLVEHWEIIRKVTSLKSAKPFVSNQLYEGLPTLEGRAIEAQKIGRRYSDGDEVAKYRVERGVEPVFKEIRLSETDGPKRCSKRPEFHIPKLPSKTPPSAKNSSLITRNSQQELALEQEIKPWITFAAQQNLHVLEEIIPSSHCASPSLKDSSDNVKRGSTDAQLAKGSTKRTHRRIKSDDINLIQSIDVIIDSVQALEPVREQLSRKTVSERSSPKDRAKRLSGTKRGTATRRKTSKRSPSIPTYSMAIPEEMEELKEGKKKRKKSDKKPIRRSSSDNDALGGAKSQSIASPRGNEPTKIPRSASDGDSKINAEHSKVDTKKEKAETVEPIADFHDIMKKIENEDSMPDTKSTTSDIPKLPLNLISSGGTTPRPTPGRKRHRTPRATSSQTLKSQRTHRGPYEKK